MSAAAKRRTWFAGVVLALTAGCSDPQIPGTSDRVEPSVHPEGWATAGSADFHGAYLAARGYDAGDCRSCHGNNHDGGLVGVTCRDCHASYPHPDGFAGSGSASHALYMRQMNFPLASCRSCHGQDYAAVKNEISCRNCHLRAAGPEACNTCHGNFTADPADLRSVAPPSGVDGETSSSEPAVGAHQRHLRYFTARATVDVCQECHHVPADVRSTGHLDAPPGNLKPAAQAGVDRIPAADIGAGRTPAPAGADRIFANAGANRILTAAEASADLIFADSMAALRTESGARIPAPAYDRAAHSCSGTYCHGNWGLLKAQAVYDFIYTADRIGGNSATPVWTNPQTAACGTCHSLPPTGHEPHTIDECATCHEGVVDNAGAIADSTLHMNGRINVFGEEYPMNR